MNYLATRFCTHCRKMRPRDSFTVLPGTRNKREVCAICRAIIMEARERTVASR